MPLEQEHEIFLEVARNCRILNWATLRENVYSVIFNQVRFKPACSATEAS